MTDAPAATTDLLTPPAAAPQPAPKWQPAGFPVTPASFDEPAAVAARASIQERISDKEFGKRLLSKDPAASAEWAALHKAGYPAPPEIASQADVDAQAAARAEQNWSEYFAALGQRISLTPANKSELRDGVVNADLRRWADEEKTRLVRDAGFRRRLLDGDRAAGRDWSIVQLLLSMRPAKDYRSPHASGVK
jgi:hypothetical protein